MSDGKIEKLRKILSTFVDACEKEGIDVVIAASFERVTYLDYSDKMLTVKLVNELSQISIRSNEEILSINQKEDAG